MSYEAKYFFRNWARKYSWFVTNLACVGVIIASFFINPGEAALDLMTINELYKI